MKILASFEPPAGFDAATFLETRIREFSEAAEIAGGDARIARPVVDWLKHRTNELRAELEQRRRGATS